MELKDYLKESFNKEYGYRVKYACDCGSEQMDIIEKCLAKYNVVRSRFKKKKKKKKRKPNRRKSQWSF